tara:strand:+ start:484 stop:1179 length:696 start_codon:yes stop_codon:yes gene_type:complete
MVCQELLTVTSDELKFNSIRLPHTFLEQIVEVNQQPPFYFRISCEIGTSIIASINEFTSDLGTVELSNESLYNLLIYNNDNNFIVKVELIKDIPKGKMIRLTPTNKEFFTIPDYDIVLEHQLAKYSILYNNQKIILDIFDKQYEVVIDNVEPNWEMMSDMLDSNVIDIVDTDLNVDINNKFIKEEEELKKRIEEIKERMDKEKKDKECQDEKDKEEELIQIKEKFLARFDK